jgi:hypothetical protein
MLFDGPPELLTGFVRTEPDLHDAFPSSSSDRSAGDICGYVQSL